MHNFCSKCYNKIFAGKKIFQIKGQKSLKSTKKFRIHFLGPVEAFRQITSGQFVGQIYKLE